MKKVDVVYAAKWYGGAVAIAVALIAIAGVLDLMILAFVALVGLIFALVFLPRTLEKKMANSALELEKTFPEKGFSYQQKFTSNSGIFYIDLSGKLAVIWKYNPKELYFANLANVTDIRTHDGQQLKGTALVSCRFKLDGKTYKIYTLRVSNGQLSMKSPQVLEAISKADKLCEMLSTAKMNANKSGAAQS